MHMFKIIWQGKGWYGQSQTVGGVTTLRFLDNDPRNDWTEERNGMIGDVARREGLGSPNWFDREPSQHEMAAGHNFTESHPAL